MYSMRKEWEGFVEGSWTENIAVEEFIHLNYKPYDGDASFLAGPTARTKECSDRVQELLVAERKAGGTLKVDASRIMRINAFGPGYIVPGKDIIVGLQTDEPLKRGICPFGGIKMVREEVAEYGEKLPEEIDRMFDYITTHNDGVFKAYSKEMRQVRHLGFITGLPDAYGRGRIIGDYRRAALYGIDFLIEEKKKDKAKIVESVMDVDSIRLSEELFQQITFLGYLKEMAMQYGFDISLPAKTAREAVQWLYFGYLGAIKEQNGAAMSLGRTSTFLDIYFERDLKNGVLDEAGAQELFDDFVMKLRMARHLRTPAYNELFAGDPMWITEALGGMGEDGRTLVTKSSYRMLHTLYNLGSSAEPNLTVLWSGSLPDAFKRFAAKVSCDTDAIQYENDDLMRPIYGDDYAIACCVSAMKVGKQMQFFGARANLAKLLLMSLNGGKDEKTGLQVGPEHEPYAGEYLEYDKVLELMDVYRPWLAKTYVNTMNIIHYMHDKYAYEAFEMSLHDGDVERIRATGIAGLSIVADSLAAIRDTKVRVIRDERGLAVDFEREGEYVPFGNNDDRTDSIAVEITEKFMEYLRQHETYRHAKPTQSILTITSNVVYGKKTGTTPDGRIGGTPFAPGANPMNGRDTKGAIAALASVAKLPFQHAHDGISYTFAVSPATLGKEREVQINNLVSLLDGYFTPDGGQHLNVNVFDKDLLIDAMEHPEKYPQLTIRVSGYAVNFVKLTREQQLDVISRTINHSL